MIVRDESPQFIGEMTTSAVQNEIPTTVVAPGKVRAWEERQKDTGWGRAFCHLIPFYEVLYAVQRRTLTPLAYQLLGGFMLGLVFGIAAPSIGEKDRDNYLTLMSLAATPVLAKLGIDKARNQAKEDLMKL